MTTFALTPAKDARGFYSAHIEGGDLGSDKLNGVRRALLDEMVGYLFATMSEARAAATIANVSPAAAKLSGEEWLAAYRAWTGQRSDILAAIGPVLAAKA